jgi:hypothetical protein
MALSKGKGTKKRTRRMMSDTPMMASGGEKKCVRINQADNGFTVSTYGPKGEQVKIANSMAAALKHTREMMGGKK